MTPRNTICLWYDGSALEAAQFYALTFPDSHVGRVIHAPADFPSGRPGEITIARGIGDDFGGSSRRPSSSRTWCWTQRRRAVRAFGRSTRA